MAMTDGEGSALTGPATKIRTYKLSGIKRDPNNVRRHSDEQIEQIADSMRTFGWTMPLLLDENRQLIAGEGRCRAAERLGFTEAPCMVATGWSDEKKRAYAIADNKLALNATWNDALLRETMEELRGVFDANALGFTDSELDKLLIDEDELEVYEVATSEVDDRFWISIRGPLRDQAAALDRLKAVMAEIPGIEVEIGTIADLGTA